MRIFGSILYHSLRDYINFLEPVFDPNSRDEIIDKAFVVKPMAVLLTLQKASETDQSLTNQDQEGKEDSNASTDQLGKGRGSKDDINFENEAFKDVFTKKALQAYFGKKERTAELKQAVTTLVSNFQKMLNPEKS